jgi:prophage regulatory protein
MVGQRGSIMITIKFYNLNDLLRQAPDGARIVPVSKPTLYRMVAAGTFPKPRKLGKRSVWSDEDIILWREQFMENVNG